ncbi:DUF4269 domain-containing protein [Roseibium sp. SCPC15]|uniref:DUF4269 domain-containing protein n=1 Tax=Roseibium sp. SCP15 TaxID=3141376 RepID=UPI003338AC26
MTERARYQDVIENLRLLYRLSEFNPVVIGTPPLGIAIESSDIDIACSAEDLSHFGNTVKLQFGDLQEFRLRSVDHLSNPAVVASFIALDWQIELFCQELETDDQWGVRHFRVEQRLLTIEPELRREVLELKQQGLKTEPAFAHLLKLPGNPYEAMLDLAENSDGELREIINHRSQSDPRPNSETQ